MGFNLRATLSIAILLGFAGTAGAVTFTCVQPGPTTWVYTLTFAPADNYNVTQSATTITLNGLSNVTAVTGPTSTDFPAGPIGTGNLGWTAQIKNGGTTVVWTNAVGGTGNFTSFQHTYGFSITATATNGTAALVTSGFSRDTNDPLPGGSLSLDVSGAIQGPAATTSVVLPQLAFGGGWYSAVYFTNTGANNAVFSVNYTGDNGKPLILPATNTSTISLNLGPQATEIVETPNAGALNQGYVTANIPPGIQGYGVFRQSVPGLPDQEAVVPLSLASDIGGTLIYDDTNYTTAVAIANPSAITITVTFNVYNSSGVNVGTTPVALPPFTHTASVLRTLPGLAGMIGQRGAVTYSVPNGNVTVLGLRFNGSAFTSIPTVGY
jgi:hypothetical protein